MTRFFPAALALVAVPSAAFAQGPYAAAGDSGDTALVAICTLFALATALPGLALTYGASARARNLLATMLQVGAVATLASLLWIVVGYTLAFGAPITGIVGAGNAWMMNNLANLRPDTQVPESAFALFEMAFAMLAPALMVGAWLDRVRFGWVLGFTALWSLVVYAPLAHWLWGGGWLGAKIGTADYAGGLVVQASAGVSALVTAVLLGKRSGYAEAGPRPHAPAFALFGTLLLWAGWLALAGGAAFAASDDATTALLNAQAAAAAAALAWLLLERLTGGKPSASGFAAGALAGLAGISAAAGFVSPGAAIVIGLLAAMGSFFAKRLVTGRLQIDDARAVFAIHGIGGMTGAILLGFFLAPALGGIGYPARFDMASMVVAQLIGVGVVTVWSAIASGVLALGVSLFLPMRVSAEDEANGLDASAHGERGWESE